ncbi:putative ABC transporter, substrate-binding protein [Parvibaculum lavamentivorans DS-1]|uniref:Putative ABC transporter, substrate-binding protein n=1 Tax=Parvibaculum lavamentivorans (strain DS-1 / DSM 13023 / NCIMB 13966) TaxID=402881 RepID=A7HSH8_PARL1|nr:putative urea ABC transporter substrate-binding protein [Parvibaculum lavamentivorans]ABS62861.1 putative ABC transporter, substrate-binding protein [Parvibaculum lavamentivorans DS-1]
MLHLSIFRKTVMAVLAMLVLSLSLTGQAAAQEKKSFKLAWSLYTGYMPWAYAEHAGIVDKWADKYGIEIEVVQINDYIESINQYTAGAYDAVANTVMDSLTIPAAGGVDTTAIILGDYTNGNDAIFIKGEGKTLADIKGKTVHLVQYSVSHYMLSLALAKAGLTESDIKTANIADADFVAAFSTPEVEVVVAWNPATSQMNQMPGITSVFNSSEVPGEVQDIVVVNTDVLKANPDFGKALAGIWFETLAIMKKDDAEGIAARTYMAQASGTDLADFESQIATTYFYDAAEGVEDFSGPKMAASVESVAGFAFAQGLLGPDAKDAGHIGIELADGTVFGDESNVKLRIDTSYMEMASKGEI